MELICIKCPRGCNITVDGDKITGNLCPRGRDYAIEEMTCPKRMVTALIKVGGLVVPVKTSSEIPKDKIFAVMGEISKIKVDSTKIGDVVLKNVLNLNVDIVVTGNPYKSN